MVHVHINVHTYVFIHVLTCSSIIKDRARPMYGTFHCYFREYRDLHKQTYEVNSKQQNTGPHRRSREPLCSTL